MDDVIDQVAVLLATRDFAWDDVILLAEAGSTMHGVGVGAQDDLDLVVVRVEPFDELVNGAHRDQSVMIRTQPEGARSGPGDIDLGQARRTWDTSLSKSRGGETSWGWAVWSSSINSASTPGTRITRSGSASRATSS